MPVPNQRLTAHRSLLSAKIAPMLAYASKPFDSVKHLFEIKWDGARCLLFLQDQQLRLQNRRLHDITSRYPELWGLAGQLRVNNVILDGELVVLSQGKSDFRRLQQREQLADPLKIEIMSRQLPATYVVFDLLYLNDRNYLEAPLIERKQVMRAILPDSDLVVESQYHRGAGPGVLPGSGGPGSGRGHGQGQGQPLSHRAALPALAEDQTPGPDGLLHCRLFPGAGRPAGFFRLPGPGHPGASGLGLPGPGG